MLVGTGASNGLPHRNQNNSLKQCLGKEKVVVESRNNTPLLCNSGNDCNARRLRTVLKTIFSLGHDTSADGRPMHFSDTPCCNILFADIDGISRTDA